MLPEALVLFACINSSGCSETSALYFKQHPDVQKQLDQDVKNVEKFIGPNVVNTFGPAVYVLAGGTGTVRLNKSFSLQFNTQKGIIFFSRDF